MSAAEQVRQFVVSDEDDGIRLDRWFKRNLPEASFGTVARWSRTGQLRLDGKRARLPIASRSICSRRQVLIRLVSPSASHRCSICAMVTSGLIRLVSGFTSG